MPPPAPNNIRITTYAENPINIEAIAVAMTLWGLSGKSFVYRCSLITLLTSIVSAVVIPINIAFNKNALAIVVPLNGIIGLNFINKLREKIFLYEVYTDDIALRLCLLMTSNIIGNQFFHQFAP